MPQITITNYSLTIEGLKINYSKDSESFTYSLDAFASCDLFKTIGLIEDYDSDGNEPIILYEAEGTYHGYEGARWNEFVKTFPLPKEYALIIAQHHEELKHCSEVFGKVGALPQQLRATA